MAWGLRRRRFHVRRGRQASQRLRGSRQTSSQPGRDDGVVEVRRRRFNLRRNPPQRGPCRKLLSLVGPERLRLSALTNFVDTPSPRRSWDRRGASLPFAEVGATLSTVDSPSAGPKPQSKPWGPGTRPFTPAAPKRSGEGSSAGTAAAMPLDEQGPSPPGRRRCPRRMPRKPAGRVIGYPCRRRPGSGSLNWARGS